MSKSKFWKILTITLSLCLILGAVIGITASASDEDGVITFDEDSYADYLTIFTNANFAEDNTWSVVDVNGGKKLLVNKQGKDTSGTTYNGGTTFAVKPTYVKDFANIATLEFDFTIIEASAYDNQFTLQHQGISGNNASPFVHGFTISALEKGVEHHIKATYQVTLFDLDGVPVEYEFVVEVDDEVVERVNTIRTGSTQLKANGGLYELPKASQVDSITFALNNSFLGDVYFDNISLKLTHEHEYSFGVCECGAEKEGFSPIEIYSKNVEYGSKTYLYYAVPKAQVPEADRTADGVWLEVADELGGEIVYKSYPQAETVDINGTECYVFISRGVPAKELNTKEYVRVMSASGGESRVEAYSAEDYLYQKLYNEAYAAKTAEDVGADGKDYLRRTLYYDLLKYGAIAQELLAPDAADKIGDTVYAYAPAAIATLGELKAGTKMVLRYDTTLSDRAFICWEYTQYDAFGEVVETGYAANGSAFYADGYLKAVPVLGSEIEHNYITFDDGASSDYVKTNMTNQKGSLVFATAGVVDGKWTVNKTKTYSEYKTAITEWNTANPDSTLTDPGSIAASTNFYPNTKVEGANIVEFVADYSFNSPAKTTLEYLQIYDTSGKHIYRAYVNNDSGYLKINSEYGVTSAGEGKAITVGLRTPIKTDGTTYELKIRYISGAAGDARFEFYCDGALFHTSQTFYYQKYMTTPPTVEEISHFNINMSNNPKGTMTYDNVAVTQVYDPLVTEKYEVLGGDDAVVDFDTKIDGYTPGVTSPNTYKIVTDPVTGDSYIEYDKTGTKSGGWIRTNLTEVQDNANVAVIEYDYYICSDATKVDTQVTVGYTGNNDSSTYPNNYTTPFFIQPNLSNREEWVRIRIEYRALEITDGKVTKVQTDLYINDVYQKSGYRSGPDATTGVFKHASTKLEIFGGTYPVPTADKLTTVTFALNQACDGTFRYDNISFRLIHVDGMDPTVVTTE
ncbi:MAG: hypothetical protein IJE25_09560 [Clostridia bacterium]|nr:hypothetical protein [Clostridia bacterium]